MSGDIDLSDAVKQVGESYNAGVSGGNGDQFGVVAEQTHKL